LTRRASSPSVLAIPYRKTVLIEWQWVGERRSYFVRSGTRSRPWIWFRDGDVPHFDEKAARVVVEKRAGRWMAVEKLESPAA